MYRRGWPGLIEKVSPCQEFIEKVLRVEKTLVERARAGGAGGGEWEVGWTILRPALLMDNFWSWQTPWLHPTRHLRQPHPRSTRLQLVWSDDVGNVAGRILSEMDEASGHIFSLCGPLPAASRAGRERWV